MSSPKSWYPRQVVRARMLKRAMDAGRGNVPTVLAPLPDEKFEVIYADPPWSFGDSKPEGIYHSAVIHYPVMTEEQLKKLDVASIAAPNCILFLWVVGALLNWNIRMGIHWGFEYSTVGFVWHKDKRKNSGNYTMSQTEFCLIYRKGKIPKPRGPRNVLQFHSEAPVRHSGKPAEFARRIETMFPAQKKIELFARAPREGWSTWGNETAKFEEEG